MGKICIFITAVLSFTAWSKGPKVVKTDLNPGEFHENSNRREDRQSGEKIWTFSLKDDPGFTYEIIYDMTGKFVEMKERENGVTTYHYLNRGNDLFHEENGNLIECSVDEKTGHTMISETGRDGSKTVAGIPIARGYNQSCFSRVRGGPGTIEQIREGFEPLLQDENINFEKVDDVYLAGGTNVAIHETCEMDGGVETIVEAVKRTIDDGVSCLLRQARENQYDVSRTEDGSTIGHYIGSSEERRRQGNQIAEGFRQRDRTLRRRAASILGYMTPTGRVKPLMLACPSPMSSAGTAFFCKYEDGASSAFGTGPYVPRVHLNINSSSGPRSVDEISQTLFHEMLHMTGMPHCDRDASL